MKDLLIIIWWRIMTYILFVLHNKQEVKCDMRKTEFLFLAWMCGWIVNSVDECWYGDSSITVCGEELWPPLLFLLWGLHIKWWHWILHASSRHLFYWELLIRGHDRTRSSRSPYCCFKKSQIDIYLGAASLIEWAVASTHFIGIPPLCPTLSQVCENISTRANCK